MPWNIIIVLLVSLLCLASPALAASVEGGCTLHFYGDSTLHAFDGKGVCEPFTLEGNVQDGMLHAPSTQVEVQVAGLDTDNSSRDKKMHEMFESETYPRIVAHFTDLNPAELLQQWQATPAGELTFDLTIRDVTRSVTARVRKLNVAAEQVAVSLELVLSLAEFGLEPPGVLGIIRVDDTVRVEIAARLSGVLAPASRPETDKGQP